MPFMNSGGSIVQGNEAIEVVEALGRAALPTAHQTIVTGSSLSASRRRGPGRPARPGGELP